MHNRNTQGLKAHAQQKRDQAFAQTERAIRQLIKEGRPVNFGTVAEAADVSRAWLYNQPELRSRIEQLRDQQRGKKKVVRSQRATDGSNAAMVRTLKEQIQKLRAENQDLRRHLEEIVGRSLHADEQAEHYRRESEALRAENVELKQRLSQSKQIPTLSVVGKSDCPVPIVPLEQVPSQPNQERIQVELNHLGIKLNSTLSKVIRSATEQTVLTALEALKEAMVAGAIKNPAGWLKRAIEDQWQPNDHHTQKNDLKLFNEWFALARAQRLVIASTQGDKEMLVLTPDEQWLPFSGMLNQYPLDTLK